MVIRWKGMIKFYGVDYAACLDKHKKQQNPSKDQTKEVGKIFFLNTIPGGVKIGKTVCLAYKHETWHTCIR